MPVDVPVPHLESGEVAAYLDRALTPDARARVEAHLDQCADCSAEIVQVARLMRTAPLRRHAIPASLAAAAALVLLLTPSIPHPGPGGSEYREPAMTSTSAPSVIAPRGAVAAPLQLVWSAVPRAGRYRVVLLDDAGALIWRAETADTAVTLPDSVRLRAGIPYFWKVDAETQFGRWVASDLVDFAITAAPR